MTKMWMFKDFWPEVVHKLTPHVVSEMSIFCQLIHM